MLVGVWGHSCSGTNVHWTGRVRIKFILFIIWWNHRSLTIIHWLWSFYLNLKFPYWWPTIEWVTRRPVRFLNWRFLVRKGVNEFHILPKLLKIRTISKLKSEMWDPIDRKQRGWFFFVVVLKFRPKLPPAFSPLLPRWPASRQYHCEEKWSQRAILLLELRQRISRPHRTKISNLHLIDRQLKLIIRRRNNYNWKYQVPQRRKLKRTFRIKLDIKAVWIRAIRYRLTNPKSTSFNPSVIGQKRRSEYSKTKEKVVRHADLVWR